MDLPPSRVNSRESEGWGGVGFPVLDVFAAGRVAVNKRGAKATRTPEISRKSLDFLPHAEEIGA